MQESFTDTESAMLPVMEGWLFAIFKALEAKRQAGMEQLGFQLTVGTLLVVSYTELQVSCLQNEENKPTTFHESQQDMCTNSHAQRLGFMCSSVTLLL